MALCFTNARSAATGQRFVDDALWNISPILNEPLRQLLCIFYFFLCLFQPCSEIFCQLSGSVSLRQMKFLNAELYLNSSVNVTFMFTIIYIYFQIFARRYGAPHGFSCDCLASCKHLLEPVYGSRWVPKINWHYRNQNIFIQLFATQTAARYPFKKQRPTTSMPVIDICQQLSLAASVSCVYEVGEAFYVSQRCDTETPDLTDDNALIGLLTTVPVRPK